MVTTAFKKLMSSRSVRVAARVGFLLAPQLLLIAFGVYDQSVHAQCMVGAPIDPRYGQSNQVGMMADFGYDTARDICRALTAISLLISSIIAIVYVRSRPKRTAPVLAKAIALVIVVPLIVHL